MAKTTFEHDIFIEVAPDKVRNWLKTLDNHHQIHPLIVNIQHVKTHQTPDGTAVDSYLIRDRMKQGPFMMTFTYRVEMSVNSQGEIVYDAHQFPNIFLHNITRCLPEGNGTRLQERVEITAPGLLMKTVYQQALDSHKEMFVQLKKILTTDPQT